MRTIPLNFIGKLKKQETQGTIQCAIQGKTAIDMKKKRIPFSYDTGSNLVSDLNPALITLGAVHRPLEFSQMVIFFQMKGTTEHE